MPAIKGKDRNGFLVGGQRQWQFRRLNASGGPANRQTKVGTESLTDDPAGKLLEGMLAAVAQFDNEVTAVIAMEDEISEVTPDILIAADGAYSTARQCAGRR